MIKLTYTYICNECGKQHEESYNLRYGQNNIPTSHLPSGWSAINNFTICPKHKISITSEEGDT